ncbi:MAG: hypothetical protein Q7S08_02730 [bacterium]|nr:hypothetical protein [bacterium]
MQARNNILLLLVLLVLPVGLVYAQFAAPATNGRIVIGMTPESPLPSEYVHLTVLSSMINLERSDITWYADKKVIAQGPGVTEADIFAGSLGTEVDIVVIAQAEDGTVASGEAFIRPTEVDLVWESDSYTPPFYKGHALPSAGTKIRAQAIAVFRLPDGTLVPDSNITYTWRRNGSVIQTASGRGRSFATFPAPTLFGTDTIEVEAVSADGTLSGKAGVNIPSVEPALLLYEDNPIFGIMYHKTFGQATTVKDAEVTFAAVPYFAEADSPDDPQLVYSWQVNGQRVTADYIRPSEITINADKSSGNADIALSLTRMRNWYMKADAEWKISFPSVGSSTGGADPFNAGKQ